MSCKFKKICKIVYEKDFKKTCMFTNKDKKYCQLTVDIQKDKVSEFVKSLIEKESNIKKSEKHNKELVTCPRSITNKISLKSSCQLKECPFNSKSLSYNCFLIHYNIYFSDYESMPESLIINGLDINKRDYKRILQLGIYTTRLLIILKKYYMETHGIKFKFKSGEIKSVFKKFEYENLCSVCAGSVFNNVCVCQTNKELRISRIKFNSNWRKTIKNRNKLKINSLSTKEFHNKYKYELYKLGFVRSLIKSVNYKGIKIYDLPFGYIFKTFNRIFKDDVKLMSENLGLTSKLYSQANKLFLEEKKYEN